MTWWHRHHLLVWGPAAFLVAMLLWVAAIWTEATPPPWVRVVYFVVVCIVFATWEILFFERYIRSGGRRPAA